MAACARAGERVAFVTLGDPNVYSTFSSVAELVAGLDPAAMDRLPDTTGLKNEVVVQRAISTLEEITDDDVADLARLSVGLRVARTLLASG